MHSEVHIANTALIRLGQPTITSLEDDNREARVVKQMYEVARDAVLSAYPWNAATRRASLALLATDPEFGYTHQHQLPPDFLRLMRIENSGQPFRIEGRTILSNSDPLRIVYVFKLTDVAKMDHLMKEAISTRLSAELAIALTGSDGRRQQELANHERVMAEARYHDALQSPMDQIGGSTWLDGRLGAEPIHRIEDGE